MKRNTTLRADRDKFDHLLHAMATGTPPSGKPKAKAGTSTMVAHVIKRPSLLRRWWWPPLPYWEMLG